MSFLGNQYAVSLAFHSTTVTDRRQLRSFGPRGSWALVTGASDGIGKQFAEQLAKAGYNLILVSRTASKLQSVSDAIKQSHSGVRAEILAMDFGANLDSDYKKLAALIKDKDVAVLINNVGQSHSIPVPFAETSESEMNNIITINCTATLRVTQLVLPAMLARKRGLILTMGSLGGLLPTPLLATYSGSKAFLQHWSSALASELEPSGITVHFVHAYLVTSAMSKVRRPSLFIPSEKQFVRSVLAKIGRTGGSVGYAYSGSPYWSHGLMIAPIISVLGAYNDWVAGINKNMHADIRKRALAKAEREKAKGKKDS